MLIQCPECKREISDMAGTCPFCGYPVSGIEEQMPQQQDKESSVQASRDQKPHSTAKYFWGSLIVWSTLFMVSNIVGVVYGLSEHGLSPDWLNGLIFTYVICFAIFAGIYYFAGLQFLMFHMKNYNGKVWLAAIISFFLAYAMFFPGAGMFEFKPIILRDSSGRAILAYNPHNITNQAKTREEIVLFRSYYFRQIINSGNLSHADRIELRRVLDTRNDRVLELLIVEYIIKYGL